MDEGTSRIRIGLPPCIVSGDYLASSSHSMLPSLFACACSMSDVRDLGVVLVRLTYCHDPPMVGPTWPRVRSALGSDCLPALSQGTALLHLDCGLTLRYLHCYRAHPMSHDWGCTSMSFPYLSMRP